MSALLDQARGERDQLLRGAPTTLQASPHGSLLSSLVVLHRVLSSPSSVSAAESSGVSDAGLELVRRLVRGAGRRLEDLLDGPLGAPPGATVTDATLVSQFVEPDLLPLSDALAVFVGRCARQQATDSSSGDALGALGVAVAVVVGDEVGPALLSLGLFSFEVPRPFAQPFDPRRHQLVERQAGPKDVVVDLQRFGRTGRGGRLLEPALVIVGDGT